MGPWLHNIESIVDSRRIGHPTIRARAIISNFTTLHRLLRLLLNLKSSQILREFVDTTGIIIFTIIIRCSTIAVTIIDARNHSCSSIPIYQFVGSVLASVQEVKRMGFTFSYAAQASVVFLRHYAEHTNIGLCLMESDRYENGEENWDALSVCAGGGRRWVRYGSEQAALVALPATVGYIKEFPF